MILGYISDFNNESARPVLCLVADKPDFYSTPVRLSTLQSTDHAIVLLSNEEGISVEINANENSRTITALRPAKLYLTPNLPTKPGFSVDKIKVKQQGDEVASIHFDRGKGWEAWQPNVRVY